MLCVCLYIIILFNRPTHPGRWLNRGLLHRDIRSFALSHSPACPHRSIRCRVQVLCRWWSSRQWSTWIPVFPGTVYPTDRTAARTDKYLHWKCTWSRLAGEREDTKRHRCRLSDCRRRYRPLHCHSARPADCVSRRAFESPALSWHRLFRYAPRRPHDQIHFSIG